MTPKRVCMRLDNVFTHDMRVRREAESLVQAGYEVTVIADYKPGQGLERDETRDGVRIRRIAKSSRIPYWSIVKPLLDERADVYHAHDINSLFPCLAAARLARGGAKVVYDSHELWRAQPADKLHAKRRMLVRFEGPMLRACDALITASPATTDVLLSRYRYPGPALTLLNAPAYRNDEQLEPYWAMRSKDGRIHVVAVSVFQHGRGAVPLIQSLAYLPEEYVVDLVGPIAQPDYEALMRAAAAPFGDRVKFVGRISPHDVIPRIASSDVSAVLTEPLSEGYRLATPNKLFDSLMAGTPIVASQMPVIERIVRTEKAGEICDVSDPADIARAIRAAHARGAEYTRSCREAARRYNWESEQQQLRSLYEQLTATGGSARC